jgi:peptidoglycan biosynthesis protein MviN/MurJ (putative lipid II flippase)
MGWMPHGGLALGNSLATFLEMLVLLYLMRRRLAGLEGTAILNAVAKSALAVGGMGLVLLGLADAVRRAAGGGAGCRWGWQPGRWCTVGWRRCCACQRCTRWSGWCERG